VNEGSILGVMIGEGLPSSEKRQKRSIEEFVKMELNNLLILLISLVIGDDSAKGSFGEGFETTCVQGFPKETTRRKKIHSRKSFSDRYVHKLLGTGRDRKKTTAWD